MFLCYDIKCENIFDIKSTDCVIGAGVKTKYLKSLFYISLHREETIRSKKSTWAIRAFILLYGNDLLLFLSKSFFRVFGVMLETQWSIVLSKSTRYITFAIWLYNFEI